MFKIFVTVILLLIKNGDMCPFEETVISNNEKNNDRFVFDKPTIIQQDYDAINKNFISKYSSKLLNYQKPAVAEYNQYLSDFVSKNIMQMAINIQRQFIQNPDVKQNVFSPISIASALSLLLVGSSGQTRNELNQLFGFNRNPQFLENPNLLHNQFGLLIEDLLRDFPHPQRMRPVSKWKYQQNDNIYFPGPNHIDREHKIEIANGVFVQKDVKLRDDYKTMIENIYKSEIISVDFEKNTENACKIINEWTKQKTNGKIKNIISELYPDTTMVIASALYFKAVWETSFTDVATSKSKFYYNGDKKGPYVLVDTMINDGVFPYYESKELGLRILGIPYKGNLSTMYVILPENPHHRDIIQIQNALTADIIEDLISKMEITTAFVTFPKMHIQNSMNLKDAFSKMGVKSLFNSQESDFSLMLDEKNENFVQNTDKTQSDEIPFIFTRFDDVGEGVKELKQKEVENDKYEFRNRRAIVSRDAIFRRRMEAIFNLKSGKIVQKRLNNHKKKIFVDDILHKVDLVLNERGTEGAAATISYSSRFGIEIDFIVDRPFIFFIRHDATKLPIFYGSISQPV